MRSLWQEVHTFRLDNIFESTFGMCEWRHLFMRSLRQWIEE